MYLKNIEINGFKSFAHKMIFEFHHGITGIVGPNGSGKSNVADAVRWVLGEQSARQLRGSRMEDVIFSGTQLRKPMGSAYVAITMDNSDQSLPIQFEEVTVARRVYRSGESEYLINGSPCRRKDIVDLFLDTGVGKEGYSIIGQGQIDQILNGRPEDRRELFDEAAGIVKYKKNKEQTQKSLEAERENLVRVNDILAELERQVTPLKFQAEKAKKYLSYKEQLKEKDIALFLLENRRMIQEIQQMEQKIAIAEREMREAKEQMQKASAEHEEEEKHLNMLECEITEVTGKISEGKISIQKQKGEIEVLKEQIHTEKTREEHYQSNKERLEQEMSEKDIQMKALEDEASKVEEKYKNAKQRILKQEKTIHSYQQEVEKLEQKLSLLRQKIQDYNNSQLKVAGRLERFQTVEEQLDMQMKNLESQEDVLKKEEDEKQQKELEFHKQTQQYKKEKQYLEGQIQNARAISAKLLLEGQEIERQMSMSMEKYHRMQSNYETLRNMAERYDGYGFGIKKVMEQKSRVSGIIGAVADIMKVDQIYESAIETALGGSIQNIVTDTQYTAKQMIEYLRQNRYGRVTFLPLDAVKGRPFSKPEALKEAGVVGIANELISYDPMYEGLFASLLGQILVVDHMENGIMIANKYHHTIRIVTMDGDSLNRGGSMSGGAFKNKSNLLGRSREMKELEEKTAKFQKNVRKIQQQKEENTKKVKEYQDSVVRLNGMYQEVLLNLNRSQMSLESLKEQKENLKIRRNSLIKQAQHLAEEKKTVKEDVLNLRDQKLDLEIINQKDKEQISQVGLDLETAKRNVKVQTRQISEENIKSEQFKQKLAFTRDNYERIYQEYKKLSNDLKHNQKSAGNIDQTVQEIKEKIFDLTKTIQQIDLENKKRAEKLISLKEKSQKVSEQYKKAVLKREESMECANGFDKEIYRLNSILEKKQERQKELLDYMWETYELTYHQVKEQWKGQREESLSLVKETITELKGKIRELGPVNVHAVEEYREIAKRYEFLSEQQQDIVKAEKHLSSLMREMEEAMRKQFREKFCEIQKMFQNVFVELFGGGVAKLELTQDDILESGIRIIAQPPGKKLQNMMQLSGGEKALTAIALLFAIQNLKPSPFCLLDEIEAALDDSNVARFANYLHKLTKDTQFIVITHRRGTMMAADILYGITMQEKGVSTQVSVNLIENDLDE